MLTWNDLPSTLSEAYLHVCRRFDAAMGWEPAKEPPAYVVLLGDALPSQVLNGHAYEGAQNMRELGRAELPRFGGGRAFVSWRQGHSPP